MYPIFTLGTRLRGPKDIQWNYWRARRVCGRTRSAFVFTRSRTSLAGEGQGVAGVPALCVERGGGERCSLPIFSVPSLRVELGHAPERCIKGGLEPSTRQAATPSRGAAPRNQNPYMVGAQVAQF